MTADESTRKPSESSYGRAWTSGRVERPAIANSSSLRRAATRNPKYIASHMTSPPTPIAIATGRTSSASGTATERPMRAPSPPPTRPAMTWGKGTRSTRRSTTPAARSRKRPRTPPQR